MGISFVEYSNRLAASVTSEVLVSGDDKAALDLMFSVMSLNFANRGHFSNAEIRVATSTGIRTARDIDDALVGAQNNLTGFAVGSYRLYMLNHDDRGNVVSGPDIPDELKDRKLQIRFVQSWLGDRNGEPADKMERLNSLMKANQNMQGQVRENFARIDQRKTAVARLKESEWKLDRMPVERVTVQLEERHGTIGPVRIFGDTYASLLELDIMYTLGGKDDIVVRDSVGKVAWKQDLRDMSSSTLLRELPERMERAHSNFGR